MLSFTHIIQNKIRVIIYTYNTEQNTCYHLHIIQNKIHVIIYTYNTEQNTCYHLHI